MALFQRSGWASDQKSGDKRLVGEVFVGECVDVGDFSAMFDEIGANLHVFDCRAGDFAHFTFRVGTQHGLFHMDRDRSRRLRST